MDLCVCQLMKAERGVVFWGGGGWRRSQITRPRESPALYKSFNTPLKKIGYTNMTFNVLLFWLVLTKLFPYCSLSKISTGLDYCRSVRKSTLSLTKKNKSKTWTEREERSRLLIITPSHWSCIATYSGVQHLLFSEGGGGCKAVWKQI